MIRTYALTMFVTLTFATACVNFIEKRLTVIHAERFYEELGRAIRLRREALGVTQGQLGERIGLSRTSVTNIERGRQRLLIDQFCRLAEELGCERDDLLASALKGKDKAAKESTDYASMPAVANFLEKTLRPRKERKT
jgi:transcriptional regulator with XRE-family HTH domain